MSSSRELPCVRCGRPVLAAVARSLPTCDRCLNRDETWEVRAGAERLRLDASGVRARLQAGTLAGTDLVVDGTGTVPLAAHPRFRAWFLAGHPDALVPAAAPAAPAPAPAAAPRAVVPRSRARPVILSLSLAVAAAAAVVVVVGRESPAPAPAPTPAPAAVTGAAAMAPVEAPVEAAPAGEGSIEALLARVGPVEDPRAGLLADAWSRRNAGTADGLAKAVVAAEQAVARAPTDPEALATLASFYAEAGTEPALRAALLERAAAAAPSAPAVRRAAAFIAIADGAAAEARRAAETCLRDVPGDLGCREALARALEAAPAPPKAAEAENQLYTLDELARAWPENRTLGKRAALLAARADLVGAEARLAAEAKRFPQDAELLAARARLAFRNGASRTGIALLGRLDAPDDALLIEAAGDAIGRGEAGTALDLLGRVAAKPPPRDALLYEAQARLLVARAGKGDPAKARDAAERLAKVDRGSPAAVQARLSAALLAGDTAAAARAWDALDPKGAPAVDVARAWLARAALDLGQNHPREALLALDTALQADRSDPDVFLWKAAASVAGQNAGAAVEALRGAVAAIDGRHARRRAYGGALALPAETGKVRTGLTEALAADPARADDLAVSLAVVAWLSGDTAGALAVVAPVADKGGDADALALRARLLLGQGQAPGALAAVDQALALRPKEVAWQLVRGEALLAVGRTGEAESALAAARSGAVPASSLQLFAAKVAAKKGDTAGALVARKAAVAADPSDLVARRALRGVTED